MDTLRNRRPKVSAFTVSPSTTHTLDFGGEAGFVSIHNLDSQSIQVQLNSDSQAQLTVEGNTNYTFNPGDLYLVSLLFNNTASGGGSVSVEVIYGV